MTRDASATAPGPAPTRAPDVALHVDQLTIAGVGAGTARRVGAAFERHLGALIETRGLPASLADASDGFIVPALDLALDASRLDVDRRRPEHLGVDLAEALWRRLDRPGRAP